MNLHHIFENSSPGRLFFRAAIPGAIGMSAISIYFMFEGYKEDLTLYCKRRARK